LKTLIYSRFKRNKTRTKGPLIIYCTGAIEEKLGGPLNFLKPERGGFEKIQRDERRGALKRFTSLKKHSFKNV
jgi:hypothetical protein